MFSAATIKSNWVLPTETSDSASAVAKHAGCCSDAVMTQAAVFIDCCIQPGSAELSLLWLSRFTKLRAAKLIRFCCFGHPAKKLAKLLFSTPLSPGLVIN